MTKYKCEVWVKWSATDSEEFEIDAEDGGSAEEQVQELYDEESESKMMEELLPHLDVENEGVECKPIK